MDSSSTSNSGLIDREASQRQPWCDLRAVENEFGQLTPENVLLYFSRSPFYDQNCCNHELFLQTSDYNFISQEKQLKHFRGIQFHIESLQYPPMKEGSVPYGWVFTVKKIYRNPEEDKTTLLDCYYIHQNCIYHCPTTYSILSSRLRRIAYSIQQSLENFSQAIDFDLEKKVKVTNLENREASQVHVEEQERKKKHNNLKQKRNLLDGGKEDKKGEFDFIDNVKGEDLELNVHDSEEERVSWISLRNDVNNYVENSSLYRKESEAVYKLTKFSSSNNDRRQNHHQRSLDNHFESIQTNKGDFEDGKTIEKMAGNNNQRINSSVRHFSYRDIFSDHVRTYGGDYAFVNEEGGSIGMLQEGVGLGLGTGCLDMDYTLSSVDNDKTVNIRKKLIDEHKYMNRMTMNRFNDLCRKTSNHEGIN